LVIQSQTLPLCPCLRFDSGRPAFARTNMYSLLRVSLTVDDKAKRATYLPPIINLQPQSVMIQCASVHWVALIDSQHCSGSLLILWPGRQQTAASSVRYYIAWFSQSPFFASAEAVCCLVIICGQCKTQGVSTTNRLVGEAHSASALTLWIPLRPADWQAAGVTFEYNINLQNEGTRSIFIICRNLPGK
jgi:hypothetical protein